MIDTNDAHFIHIFDGVDVVAPRSVVEAEEGTLDVNGCHIARLYGREREESADERRKWVQCC